MLFGDGPKGNKFADPGIGENNIDSPLHVGDGLVKTIKVSQLGNVSLNSRNVDADCLHGLVEFLLVAARDEDIGTLFGEELCRSQPNSLSATRDNRDFSIQLTCFAFGLWIIHNLSVVLLTGLMEGLHV